MDTKNVSNIDILRAGLKAMRDAGVFIAESPATLGETLVKGLLESPQYGEAAIAAQRERVVELRKVLKTINTPSARLLDSLADYLVRKTVWALGGDG